MDRKRILIAGGSGFVGSRLTELLIQRGYEVCHLARSRHRDTAVKTYLWNVERKEIDKAAFSNAEVIINLAGAGIADKRWSPSRKRELLESRAGSADLIRKTLAGLQHQVHLYLSASGVGYYGTSLKREFHENDSAGNDFLAHLSEQWERHADAFAQSGIRVVKMRTALVLGRGGGALVPFVKSIRALVGAPLGSGDQWISWIHIDDLCRMYIHAIEHEKMAGPYNAAAPHSVTNRNFTQDVAKVLGKPLILPNVPAFVLKLALGELSMLVLEGTKVSARKITDEGFVFEHPSLEGALRNLLTPQ